MVIVIFFNLNTISLITLIELSEYVKGRRLVVYYLWRYFRQANIQFVYRKYRVK
jgi:hypothetical protein